LRSQLHLARQPSQKAETHFEFNACDEDSPGVVVCQGAARGVAGGRSPFGSIMCVCGAVQLCHKPVSSLGELAFSRIQWWNQMLSDYSILSEYNYLKNKILRNSGQP